MILKQRTGQEHVDIITFYNEIFIPSVKALLVELGPGGTTTKVSRMPEANSNGDGTFLSHKLFKFYTCFSVMQLQQSDYFYPSFHFPGHLAQCPGSPKISTFPSLPDMSPKKVSAVHNVYVSPLRSSKVLL